MYLICPPKADEIRNGKAWPERAAHGVDFFPERYHAAEETGGYYPGRILQYPFENGRTMREMFPPQQEEQELEQQQ